MVELDLSAQLSSQLFLQAATLMFVGMGFVFAFLAMLMLVIRFFITPLAKRFPDKTLQKNQPKNTSNQENSAIVAAITVAINKYRHQHK